MTIEFRVSATATELVGFSYSANHSRRDHGRTRASVSRSCPSEAKYQEQCASTTWARARGEIAACLDLAGTEERLAALSEPMRQLVLSQADALRSIAKPRGNRALAAYSVTAC